MWPKDMGDRKQDPADAFGDDPEYASQAADSGDSTIDDPNDTPTRTSRPTVYQQQQPLQPATYGNPFPGYNPGSQFTHGPSGNFANPAFGHPLHDNRPSRASAPPQTNPLDSLAQPMTNNITTHYHGYTPTRRVAAPANPFSVGFPPQTPSNSGTGSPWNLPGRITPVAAPNFHAPGPAPSTHTPAPRPGPQQGSNYESSPSPHRSPSPDSDPDISYACMSSRFRPRGNNYRIIDRREEPPTMTDSDRDQVQKQWPIGPAEVIGQGQNSGMGWMGFFDSRRPKVALTRCPIQVRRGRGGPGRGGSSVFAGYPPYTEPIPAGLSLQEICRRFPNHVWGDMLRIFKSEGMGGHDIYEAFSDAVKNQCATNAKKTKDRPHNFLQAALGREVDMMFNEDRIYRRIIKNKNKGRKKVANDDDDRKGIKRRRVTQPHVDHQSGGTMQANEHRSSGIDSMRNSQRGVLSGYPADPYGIVHAPTSFWHNGVLWVPNTTQPPQRPRSQPRTSAGRPASVVQVDASWSHDSFTSQEQWEEYTRSQPLAPNERIWVSNRQLLPHWSDPSLSFGGQSTQGTARPSGHSSYQASLLSTGAVANDDACGTDCDLTIPTGNPSIGHAQNSGASTLVSAPGVSGIPTNNRIRSPESVTAADNKGPNDLGSADEDDDDTSAAF